MVKDTRFDETPVRMANIEREKTGYKLKGFLNAETVDILKTVIRTHNLQPSRYIFVDKFNNGSTERLRRRYNIALAKAGFGENVTKHHNHYYARVIHIHSHKLGKFHLKVYEKRFYSLAIGAGVPDEIVQAMLGRKQYLDQYLRMPLVKKQEFAAKILRAVSIYRDKANKAEMKDKVKEILGMTDLADEQFEKIMQTLRFQDLTLDVNRNW